ncbi:ScbA/BarX family gamma-butyrolactone biosynthesis protein [Streptomyces goshikiensis]|uniref:ScbA/BarX family gamma-butyrolactone biosynthesis protein n=1 Tax=Streptomyces TaxID=1883 RepID=UPI000AE525DC|nr:MULTISPECIES: ScbA/BarX family gamma-butyrolactone biosynthesis protein [Streptomyces]MBP0932600.1 transcriptional regulator [Streptomyces sp. KCTC 0041BP]GHD82089.1 adhesin [Streptomyces goshikiensis]
MSITTERPEIAGRSLTTTVAREYVHRAALSEVFLTGWEKVGTDAFTVTAQWPRSHSFYTSEQGFHDPLMLCETLRQCGLLLTHVGYQVPFDHSISWSRLQYAVNPQALRIEHTPAEIELHVTCSDVRYRHSQAVTMTMHIEAVRNGTLLAAASIGFCGHSPAMYQRLRSGRNVAQTFKNVPTPPAAVSRYAVGRSRTQDIVLAPTSERWRWQLRVDTNHPVLFDHPLDHVPGMLLLESVRQAGHALQPSWSPMIPTSMDVSFNRYVEFDDACWIEAEPLAGEVSAARRTVRVNALQGGAFAFTACAEMTDVSSI